MNPTSISGVRMSWAFACTAALTSPALGQEVPTAAPAPAAAESEEPEPIIVTVEAGLNQLPQFAPASTGGTNLPPNGGRANLNLRGLGPGRNLVLLDGKRLPPADASDAVDVNTIPVGLIESIEIITGGASATYGSDAKSGVANFRLKRQLEASSYAPPKASASKATRRRPPSRRPGVQISAMVMET